MFVICLSVLEALKYFGAVSQRKKVWLIGRLELSAYNSRFPAEKDMATSLCGLVIFVSLISYNFYAARPYYKTIANGSYSFFQPGLVCYAAGSLIVLYKFYHFKKDGMVYIISFRGRFRFHLYEIYFICFYMRAGFHSFKVFGPDIFLFCFCVQIFKSF